MLSLRLFTLGCSKNTVDSEHLLGMVSPGGFDVVPEGYEGYVDVLLFNTCGFIGDAKEESIQAILEGVERKKAGLVGRIVVFGCLSQRYPAELREEIPEVDAWFGARGLGDVAEYLWALTGGASREGSSWGGQERYRLDGRPFAFLKISEGCDRRCSYCAIPLIRGPHRSVPIPELCREAERLAAQGVRELIVIAQDSTFYGLDLYGRRALAELLRALSAVEGISWIRLHYSYPADFPEDVLDEMASNPKICKYLDIPLQHCADPVLQAMRRGVTARWTRELIARMRARVPGVVLRTTLMVGHPGEGAAEFEELLDFVREARFERMGAFCYSEEDGTWGASHLADSVSAEEKAFRLDALMSLQGEISLACNQARVGTVERVLVDSCVDGTLVCRSQYESPDVDGEILVRSDSPSLVGQFIDVRIVGADEYDLIAELV